MPEKPKSLKEDVSKKTTTSIHVIWDPPDNSKHPEYVIEWFIGNSNKGSDTVKTTSDTITGLNPGQKYKIKVWTLSNAVKSEEVNGDFATGLYVLHLY